MSKQTTKCANKKLKVPDKFSQKTAIAIVVANMIGTGVFTSLGFQLESFDSTFVLMMLWLVGGFVALFGALGYAELSSRFPRSGGEYNFLSETYHPVCGFVSGWVSATVGFAAPVALAAITFESYLKVSLGSFPDKIVASSLIFVLTYFHATSRTASESIQLIFTLLKVLLILGFSGFVIAFVNEPQPVTLVPDREDFSLVLTGAFAISLIYVNYAFTGWNAATYILGEIEEARDKVSHVLFFGTLIVLVLYLLLNYVFLYAAPKSALRGELEIGVIVAKHAFGDTGLMVVGIVLAALLISTISAMIIAGPRVFQVLGEDYTMLKWFAKKNQFGLPSNAIFFQAMISIAFVLTSSFQTILMLSGFVVGLNSFFAVAGIFVLRRRNSGINFYKMWGYPLTPAIYLILMGWSLFYVTILRPEEALFGFSLVFLGFLVYFLLNSKDSET